MSRGLGDVYKRQLYHGPLNSREITEYLSLGVLKKGEKGALSFHVYVPEELDNAYSLQNGKVRWWFMAENRQKETETLKTSTEKTLDKTPVKTGDTTTVLPYVFLTGCGLLTTIVLGYSIRKRRKKLEDSGNDSNVG